jgi:hypothetical protein
MKTASAETRALVVKAYTSGIATRKQLAEIFGYHIQCYDTAPCGHWEIVTILSSVTTVQA